MSSTSYIEQEHLYGAANYKPLPVVIARGKGAWLWDNDGKKYLDMMSAYSAVSHGHSHPRLLKAMTDQAAELAVVSRAFHAKPLGPFLEKLTKMTGLPRALPMNTGVEAVETAIKAARRWGYRVKGIPADQAEIIVAEGNFHGRSTTVIGFSADEEYKEDFGPFAAGFVMVPFGDIEAVKAAITPNTAAVIMEPIQGEAGIVMPPKGFLKQLRALCTEQNCLMILDEIQSGLGRTGKLFAHNHEDIKPDGLILGKALGGGMMPVSAFCSTNEVMDMFDPGSHGSTFGGNPLAAAVAHEALNVIEDEHLTERSAELGAHLKQSLRAMNSPLIDDVRGAGLWVGVEIDPQYAPARLVCERLMTRGVLSKETHGTVVRFAPPLVISKDDLDWGIEQFRNVIRELEDELLDDTDNAKAS